jgi:hypothetical protein
MAPRSKKLLVRVKHEELDVRKLVEHLDNDLVYVFFRKKTNGRFRSIYPFTRNRKYLPYTEQLKMYYKSSEDYMIELMKNTIRDKPESVIENRGHLIKAYSILDRGWRSFYTQNLLFYEVYDHEGDTLE